MSIAIKEVYGYKEQLALRESRVEKEFDVVEGVKSFEEPMSPNSLMVDIEGIHSVATRNNNRYMREGLKKSIPSWTTPYQKPMIMHHNEKDGKIIGRIKSVSYVTRDTRSGTPALLFSSNISDKEGIEQVEDGRLTTVSIGIIAYDVRCSICGHNIAKHGECIEHDKGEYYDGEKCYWDIYEFEGKELSYVIVPSDVYASNVKIHKKAQKGIQESLEEKKKEVLNLSESKDEKVLDTKEERVLDEDGEKKEKDSTSTKDFKNKVSSEVIDTKDSSEETPEDPKEDKDTIISKLQKRIKDLVKVKDDALKELEDVKNTLGGLQNDLASVSEGLEEEKALREKLEEVLEEKNTSIKETIIEKILDLRESAGLKEIDKEKLLRRTEESLKDALFDLEESFEGTDIQEKTKDENPDAKKTDKNKEEDSQSVIESVENPGLVEQNEEDLVNEEEKESNTNTKVNINLKEEFSKIFD